MHFIIKQKTAYEVRISDLSSDVCSSDLGALAAGLHIQVLDDLQAVIADRRAGGDILVADLGGDLVGQRGTVHGRLVVQRVAHAVERPFQVDRGRPGLQQCGRSEEHTSELQSLMRISYAVFCLKKKNKRKTKLMKLQRTEPSNTGAYQGLNTRRQRKKERDLHASPDTQRLVCRHTKRH